MDTTTRALDGGGPLFLLPDPGAQPAGGRGVCVETPFEVATSADQIVLSLRRAEWHDGGPADVEIERFLVTLSLGTGQCSPRDASARRFLDEHPWIVDSLRPHEACWRDRARRLLAQRDRTSCFAAFAGARPGAMIPHDALFPGDWDLLFEHDGRTYWAVEHHCTTATCTCREVMVMLYEIDPPRTEYLGDLRVDFSARQLEPKASQTRAADLFEPLWAHHGAELLMRYGEVRRALQSYAATRAALPLGGDRGRLPTRNAPCPCGSGRKYKRCCAGPQTTALASRSPR